MGVKSDYARVVLLCLFFVLIGCAQKPPSDEAPSEDLKQLSLNVEGIIQYDKDTHRALVNGELVGVGDSLSGARVVEITDKFVTFEYQGKPRTEYLRLANESTIAPPPTQTQPAAQLPLSTQKVRQDKADTKDQGLSRTSDKDFGSALAEGILNPLRKANEVAAQARLKHIFTAGMVYMEMSDGTPPKSISDLSKADESLLEPASYEEGVAGYKFSIVSEEHSFKVIATPLECGKSGSKTFIQESDGAIFEQDCR